MDYDFTQFKNDLKETEDWLRDEFSNIRTGRATPKILDSIRVDAYGSKVPIQQIGNVTTEDAKTLRVTAWDTSLIPPTEKAIIDADIGVSVSSDEKGLWVKFPQLTEETREKLLKVAKERHEEARITVRTKRDEVWHDIQDKEMKGEISEDEKFRLKDEMQNIVDESNKELDEYYEKKEKEIAG